MIIIPEPFDQDLQILQITVADEITLTFCATSPTATCPDCGMASARIHGRYSRTLHDFPTRRRPVHLVVQVRRFRCQKSTCARKSFAEQFPQLARPHAQRTLQLQEALYQVGMVLGGQAGADLGSQLGLSGSRDTILRLLRMYQLSEATSPKKVGVDDWAWKRGHRYGTLVCDLEREIPIDLLPDRSVETVTTWFENHPTIDLISRDRASEYALATRKGAPRVGSSRRSLARDEKPWRGSGGTLGPSSHDLSEEENAGGGFATTICHSPKAASQTIIAARTYSADSSRRACCQV